LTNPLENASSLIRELYQIVAQLEEAFPGRKFTPDGHLVGSLGEVFAAERYGLTLLRGSAEIHDATTSDGRLVQIKATQGRNIGLRSEPEYLLVLRITKRGEMEEVYTGGGWRAWEVAGRMQKNGQRPVSLSRLRRLMDDVPSSERIADKRSA
jgi:hypothetical protein